MGGLDIEPPLYGGPITLQSRGQNQKWPTNGRIGNITLAVWGVPNTLEWGQIQGWPTNGQIGCITLVV